MRRFVFCFCFAIALCLAITSRAIAGISADNVVVVVNGQSLDSRTIANHYVQLRGIPSGNVVFLDEVPDGLKVSLDDFKTKILSPLLAQINARGLAAQTRVIAYSAGFPTGVDISPHTSRLTDEMQKKYQTPLASLNSMTFFYRFILADDPGYLNWYSNLYARSKLDRSFINPFAGEKAERFKSARESLETGDAAKAGNEFRDLFLEYPTLAPLAVLAAEAFVKADDQASAIQMTAAALHSGWTSISYLKKSDSLSPLLEETLVKNELGNTREYPSTVQYPIGFSSIVGWTSSGCPVKPDAGGMPYLLSCSLAVVHPHASTLDQAIEVLRRASKCDRTFPIAEVRFSKTSDVRTTTRFPGVADALVWLNNNGVKTQIFPNAMSTTPGKCVGMMLGTATMDLDHPPFEFVPGAIAENLTSLGAAFETPSQTKLTSLLHAGVAMSSGAVAEPYSLQPKFPVPMLYPYYLEGVTAMEAFYLATSSPYQLLIVGDPLAQPFARASGDLVTIRSEPEKPRHLTVERRVIPGLNKKKYTPTHKMELLLNGRMVAQIAPMAKFDLKISDDMDGACEVRVVLVSDPVLETRISSTETIELSQVDVFAEVRNRSADRFDVEVKCVGADRVELYHLGTVVGEFDGESSTFTVDRMHVGAGPIQLQPIALRGKRQSRGKEFVVE